jgi:DNA-binding NarL/FixJ family response regulator
MIRLLLVDNQTPVCQWLKAVLHLEKDLQVVGVANDGKTAIEQVATLLPDLVLMHGQMPGIDDRTATRMICQRFPEVKVLICSTVEDSHSIIGGIRAGVKGYLLKDTPAQELVQAIRLTHRGYVHLGPGLLEKLMTTISRTTISRSTVVDAEALPQELLRLTPREQEVLYWISIGATNREIAEQLYITEKTVRHPRRSRWLNECDRPKGGCPRRGLSLSL